MTTNRAPASRCYRMEPETKRKKKMTQLLITNVADEEGAGEQPRFNIAWLEDGKVTTSREGLSRDQLAKELDEA